MDDFGCSKDSTMESIYTNMILQDFLVLKYLFSTFWAENSSGTDTKSLSTDLIRLRPIPENLRPIPEIGSKVSGRETDLATDPRQHATDLNEM